MLLSTGNEEGQATCPKCEKVVTVIVLNGNLAFSPRYLEFKHNSCGIQWKSYFDSGKIELINKHKVK